MKYFDQTLQDTYQKINRKKQLEVTLKDLHSQLETLKKTVEVLDKKRQLEQSDVERLEGRSLATFFYNVVGIKEEKLDKERQEAYAAAVKYDVAYSQQQAIMEQINRLEAEMKSFGNLQKEYAHLLEEKSQLIKDSAKQEAHQILQMEEKISFLEHQKQEIKEAIQAGNRADQTIDDILSSLDSAKDWSTFDMLGGGLVSDMIKHSHLDEAQKQVEKLQSELRGFKTELADVKIQMDIKVSIDGFMKFADYFFDNLFTDWTVRDKIVSSKQQIIDTRNQIDHVLKTLTSMEDKANKEQENIKKEIERIVVSTTL